MMKKILISSLVFFIAPFTSAETQTISTSTNNQSSAITQPMNTGINWLRQPQIRILPGDLEGKPRKIETWIEADTDGKITHVKIIRSSGLADLDDLIIHAIKKARFRPHLKNGIRQPIQVMQPFEVAANDYSSTLKSPKPSVSPNLPVETKCAYNFNSEVIQSQRQMEKTQFTYLKQPSLYIPYNKLDGQNRSITFKFKVSRKNIISDIQIIERSGVAEIDGKVLSAISNAQIQVPRKFYQLSKLEFQDKIQFKLNECFHITPNEYHPQ